jgi:hypothetical protein
MAPILFEFAYFLKSLYIHDLFLKLWQNNIRRLPYGFFNKYKV